MLDWNEPAIGFWKSIGAISMDKWVRYRLTGEALTKFASEHFQVATALLGEGSGSWSLKAGVTLTSYQDPPGTTEALDVEFPPNLIPGDHVQNFPPIDLIEARKLRSTMA